MGVKPSTLSSLPYHPLGFCLLLRRRIAQRRGDIQRFTDEDVGFCKGVGMWHPGLQIVQEILRISQTRQKSYADLSWRSAWECQKNKHHWKGWMCRRSDLHRASGEDFGGVWESYLGQKDQDMQNAMEWPHREDEPMKTYPDLFASQPRISGRDSYKGVGFVTP